MSSLLIKWPSRQRPERFFATLAQWLKVLSGKHSVHFLFSFDAGDVMASQENARRLQSIFPTVSAPWLSYQAIIGPAVRTKVQAINADVDVRGVPAWDLLILASDDMWPRKQDIDDTLACACGDCDDTALWVHDGYRRDGLCTIPVMTRSYYDRFGYIYHPAYTSLWCDNEWSDIARSHEKLAGPLGSEQDPWIEHQHPCNDRQKFNWDDLYRAEMSNSLFQADKLVYEQRKAGGAFAAPLAAPKPLPMRSCPVLTVMIPTIVEREADFRRLLNELNRQIMLLPDPTLVQVIWKQDNCEMLVGDKRQQLLLQARGDYVCAIDDDDLIEPTYLRSILSAILDEERVGRSPDCVVFRGEMTLDGRYNATFDFDLGHKAYRNIGDLCQRTPNHLCPIKRSIAMPIGFVSKQCSEDTDFAQRVYPKLRTQVIVRDRDGHKKLLYHYRYSRSGTRTQREEDKAREVVPT